MSDLVHTSKPSRALIASIAFLGSLGGLLFGLDQGFIANSLSTLTKHYSLSVAQGETYSAILAWGGIAGALCSGLLIRFFGRKLVIVLAGFLFTLMSLLSMLLLPLSIMMFARFFIGFAVGLASFVVPIYLSETAPTRTRGRMTTLFQLMITIGILAVAVINVIILAIFKETGLSLSIMFGVLLIFSALMLVGSFFLPESPRWLVLRGKMDKAKKILSKVSDDSSQVQDRLDEINQAVNQNSGFGFSLLRKGYFWKIFFVGVGLQMFQQLVGINAMIYYAPTIFGYAKITGVVASLIVPVVNVLFTFPALSWIERWGRKRLLYFGSVLMFVALVVAGITFAHIGDGTNVTLLSKVVLFAAVVVYIFGFASSWGPVAWVLCAEIFPIKGKEMGVTVTTMINWTFAGLVLSFALTIIHIYGTPSLFYLFAFLCLLSLVFVYFFVPETKGISLEKYQEELESGKKLRQIGRD